MQTMIASVDLKKRGVRAGQRFEADESNARLLVRMNKATRAVDEEAPAPDASGSEPAPLFGASDGENASRRGRRYQRRDMQAAD